MKLAILLGASLMAIALMAMPGAQGVKFEAINNATTTPGGIRFENEIGLEKSKRILNNASSFIWKTFRQTSPNYRKSVNRILLILEPLDGVAYTESDEIHLSSDYVATYNKSNLRTEIEGVLFHETTHVWQWGGNHKTPWGLIEGIADYVRLKAGLAPSHWVKPGEGDSWDQGYDVTALFLDYCNGNGTFIADLNVGIRGGYSDDLFVRLLGKTVGELWKEYKAAYGN